MKKLKYIIAIIVIVLFIATLNLFFYLNGLKPTYDGEIQMSGNTAPVEVKYDQYGIPHIYASNTEDAYRALGYVHAQDRLWQMELMRRIAPGRLSEMFGEQMIETDKFFKTLGLHRQAKNEAITFLASDSPAKPLTIAYLEGVNQFMEEGPTPIEFMLLGLDKEKYTVEDVFNVMGYMAFSFAQGQKSDHIVTKTLKELGPKYLKDLNMTEDGSSERIKNYPSYATLNKMVEKMDALEKSMPAPAWLGSNSWVVSPSKSATGKGYWLMTHIWNSANQVYGMKHTSLHQIMSAMAIRRH